MVSPVVHTNELKSKDKIKLANKHIYIFANKINCSEMVWIKNCSIRAKARYPAS
jgi:hypothetical protein